MKATLEFDLNDEADKEAYAEVFAAKTALRFYDELYDRVFREPIKYGLEVESHAFNRVWEKVREFQKELEE